MPPLTPAQLAIINDSISKHSGLTTREVNNASNQSPDVQYYLGVVSQGLAILDPLVYTDQERARDELARLNLDTQNQIARSSTPVSTAGAASGAGALTTVLIVAGVAGVGFLIWSASRKK